MAAHGRREPSFTRRRSIGSKANPVAGATVCMTAWIGRRARASARNSHHERHLWNAATRIGTVPALDGTAYSGFEAWTAVSNTSASSRIKAAARDKNSSIPLRIDGNYLLCRGGFCTSFAPHAIITTTKKLRVLRHPGAGGAFRECAFWRSAAIMRLLSLRSPRSIETWILPRSHEASFERSGTSRVGSLTDLAVLLRRT